MRRMVLIFATAMSDIVMIMNHQVDKNVFRFALNCQPHQGIKKMKLAGGPMVQGGTNESQFESNAVQSL